MSRRVLLVAERGLRDDELAAARHELAGLGLDTRVASPPGARLHGELGADRPLDLHLGDVGPEAFDAIVVVGGPGATARGPEAAADLARRVAARLEANERTWPGGPR